MESALIDAVTSVAKSVIAAKTLMEKSIYGDLNDALEIAKKI